MKFKVIKLYLVTHFFTFQVHINSHINNNSRLKDLLIIPFVPLPPPPPIITQNSSLLIMRNF